jgi:hypothetical protein
LRFAKLVKGYGEKMSDKDLFPSSAIREREYLSVKYRKKIKEDYLAIK